jgi:hypothetical protein
MYIIIVTVIRSTIDHRNSICAIKEDDLKDKRLLQRYFRYEWVRSMFGWSLLFLYRIYNCHCIQAATPQIGGTRPQKNRLFHESNPQPSLSLYTSRLSLHRHPRTPKNIASAIPNIQHPPYHPLTPLKRVLMNQTNLVWRPKMNPSIRKITLPPNIQKKKKNSPRLGVCPAVRGARSVNTGPVLFSSSSVCPFLQGTPMVHQFMVDTN